MKWHELLYIIKDYPITKLKENNTSADLQHLMFLNPILQTCSKNILYVGSYDTYIQCKTSNNFLQASVLLLCDKDVKLESDTQSAANIICIYEKDAFVNCVNELDALFSEMLAMESWLKKLHISSYKGASLNHIVNQIAEYYQHPVNVVDNAYTVIAYSKDIPSYNTDLQEDSTRGYVEPDIIKKISPRTMRQGKLTEDPIIIEHFAGGEFIHYNTPILSNKVPVGFFSIYLRPDETLSYVQHQYLPELARILSLLVTKATHHITANSNYCSGILESLLNNTNVSNANIESRLAGFGYHLLCKKYLFVIKTFSLTNADLSHVCNVMQDIIKNSIYTIIENDIVFLGSYSDNEFHLRLEEIQEHLCNFLSSFPMIRIGISSCFESLTDISAALAQCYSAIEIGRIYEPKLSLYHYDDYRLECMVYQLSKTTNISMFCYPQLYSLLEYDSLHQTQLLYTLFVYIFCPKDKNIEFICKTLNIHKNTLYFRLNKIRELIGLDYDSPSVIAMIIFSFSLLRINNDIDWSAHDL